MSKLTQIMSSNGVFSTYPFQKDGSEDLIKAAKAGDLMKVKTILFQKGKFIVYDYDQVCIWSENTD